MSGDTSDKGTDMADPTKYNPHFNYSGWEAAGPNRPKPGAELDIDFANIARSVDETIDALKDIRRSDGKLKNGIVDKDALDESARELWESAETAAENAKGSAQSAAGSAQSAGESAEAARDYASDAVSQGNVPIYASVVTVEGLNINPNITAIRTNGYYDPGDGGGALYKRVASEPSHAGKIQSSDGAWWEIAERTLHVRMFGAVPDGNVNTNTGTDNTDAFNAATAYIREKLETTGIERYVAPMSIVIPPGKYRIGSSWDLRDFRGPKFVHVVGYGATLFGGQAGYPILDASDSRWLCISGLTVLGHPNVVPRCGIQIGKTGIRNSQDVIIAVGNNRLNDVTILGHFDLAALLNEGCETTSYHGCYFIQNELGHERYAVAMSGSFVFGLTSLYTTIDTPEGEQTSFTQNSFNSCQIRNEGNGPAYYTNGGAGHYLDQGCYLVAFRDACCVIDARYRRTQRFTLHGHFENAGTSPGDPAADGLEYIVRIVGAGNTAITGLDIVGHTVHASKSIVHFEGLSNSRLDNLHLSFDSWHNSSATGSVFSGDSNITATGRINITNASRLNLGHLSSFRGDVLLDDMSEIESYCTGSYRITDRLSSRDMFVGTVDQARPSASGASLRLGNSAFTPTVTFTTPGDLSVSYSVQQGWYKRFLGMVYIALALRFTPTFTTASGDLRVGGLPVIGTVGTPASSGLHLSDFNCDLPAGARGFQAMMVPNMAQAQIRVTRAPLRARSVNAGDFVSGREYDIVISGIYHAGEV